MLHVVIINLVCINRGPDFERVWHEGSKNEYSVLNNYWPTIWILSFDCFETITIIILTTTIQRNRKNTERRLPLYVKFLFLCNKSSQF